MNRTNKILIIADDLTGALDSCVKFSEKGFKCRVFIYNQTILDFVDDYDVVAIDTESRHLSSEEAYQRVFNTVKNIKDKFSAIYKKTDSLLRGNVGSEFEGVLSATGKSLINFVPAYPSLGRTTKNGIQYVHDIPISESELARDLLNPIVHSNVADIITEHTNLKCGNDDETNNVVIWDCETDEQMYSIAKKLYGESENFILAGCAGFLDKYVELSSNKDIEEFDIKQCENLIVICGSINLASKKQIAYLEENGAERIKIAVDELLNHIEKVKEDVIQKIGSKKSYDNGATIEVGNSLEQDYMAGKEKEIAAALGTLTKELVSKYQNTTYMIIGGDTLLEVIEKLKINKIIPMYEIESGTIVSECSNEENTIRIISKSGGFGKEDLVFNILKQIKKVGC